MKTMIINSRVHGKKIVFYDDYDHDWISQFKWYLLKCAKQHFYVARNIYGPDANGKIKNQKRVQMHREIMGFPDAWVDHKDGNGLNNTRENLRLASPSQNATNTHSKVRSKTGYKGVYFSKQRQKFTVQIRKDRKLISLGRFKTKEEAALCYNEAALKYHGEFASLNQI